MKFTIILAAAGATLLSTGAGARERETEKVMPNGEKVICKGVEETGSLVRKIKRCYTRGQWDRIAEAARNNAERMVGDHAAGLTTN